MRLAVGEAAKILKGTHAGKKGVVGSNRPRNGHEKGKVPVVVGNRNDVFWVRPDWVSSIEDFPPLVNTTLPDVPESLRITEVEGNILDFLTTKKYGASDIALATHLDASLMDITRSIKSLITQNLITETERDNYKLCNHNQSKQSDSLRELGDSAEQPTSLEDLSGLNPSRSTTMQFEYCENTTTITSITEISETIPLLPAVPIYTPSDSPAPEPVTLETVTDSTTLNQASGLKPCDVSVLENPGLSLWNNLKDLSAEDFERCLEDSEWQDITGNLRYSYRARKLELHSDAPDFLQLPTLTALRGKNARPGGTTVCDKAARKLGLIHDSQLLSMEAMATISGFPQNWTKCLSGLRVTCSPEGSKAECSTAAPSSPNKQLKHSNESNIFTPLQPGLQWLDPNLVIIKEGTQSRDCDRIYEVIPATVQKYAEMMQDGLWEWERSPLPVAFVDGGKIYAGDCHHRVTAARIAGKQIYIDLRCGDLAEAKLHSVTANNDHGLPLRPKDQRRRVEMFLDTIATLSETRSQSLLKSVSGITDTELRNGKWSARVIAKYLRMAESGYRTIINILQERDRVLAFTALGISEGEYVKVKGDFNWVGKIHTFDKRKGCFVIPLPWTVGNDGRMLISKYVEPSVLISLPTEEVQEILEIEKHNNDLKEEQKTFTSVADELTAKAKSLGVPIDGLPEVDRNEGDPTTLEVVAETAVSVNEFFPVGKLHELDDAKIQEIWKALAPRIKQMGLINAES